MSATGSEAVIEELLLQKIGQVATALDPALPVAYPDVAFTPTERQPYLAVNVLPNTSDLDGLAFDSSTTHTGLLSIQVVWPSGQGRIKPKQVVARIISALKPGTLMARDDIRVDIDRQPEPGPAIPDGNTVTYPIVVRWTASAPPNA